MTTAAPPEKMMGTTDAELAAKLVAFCDREESANDALFTDDEEQAIREAARRLAPRVGDDGLDTTEADAILAEIRSAPPAASAERELADEFKRRHAEWFECRGYLGFDDLAPVLAEVALGYRKRAAQGVGEFAAELVKECEAYRRGANIYDKQTLDLVLTIIRRLSALPKGQEHEG